MTAQPTNIEYDASREIRFAVVIYGGVSLAVYINGVAQELLRLVRATAPDPENPNQLHVREPRGSERVYRKLGQILGDPERSVLDTAQQLHDPANETVLPVRSRFVIDVLSGTSAGGINAVYLAKAIANDQGLDALENVWKTEGDISTLINDKGSLEKVKERLVLQSPPTSLLNGQRMYLQLLDALDAMDEQHPAGGRSPLVERLDLFCTATDLAGLRVRLPIADGMIDERRYRNVFHFQHPKPCAEDKNDFGLTDNPFLAFAARCTSAFPFAFEPMTLSDIYPVLRTATAHRDAGYCDPALATWKRFYPDYARDRELAFADRPFGDGGYLDNKPFSYAIDTTLTRHSDLPVDRKLIYIEPKPEGSAPVSTQRPDAIQNSLAALTVLPRVETIREDLNRVIRRNAEVARVNRVLKDVLNGCGQDLREAISKTTKEQWLDLSDEQLARKFGAGYAAYQRLKLSEVTDQLSNLIANSFGMDPASPQRSAIRVLLGAWRDREVTSNRQQRQFLLDFDVGYRLRRLRHVGTRITALHETAEEQNALETPSDIKEYRAKLRQIKRDLGSPHRALRRVLECGCELGGKLEPPVTLQQLDFIAAPPTDSAAADKLTRAERRNDDVGANERAKRVLNQSGPQIERLESALSKALLGIFENASAEARRASAVNPEARPGILLATQQVATIYEGFEAYDSMFFPITFGTDTGEGETIDIHRISPDDTSARKDVSISDLKLKGQALGSFGAFLDETWRKNDILWGRLDGAERLIEILLPGVDQLIRELRTRLIDEAHEAIVREFLEQHELPWLGQQPAALVTNWRALLGEYLTTQIRVEPRPAEIARAAARSTAVTGQIFEAIFEKPPWLKRPLSWLATLGNVALALVEVAVPHSLPELLFGYWIQLLLVISLVVAAAAGFAQSIAAAKLSAALFAVSVLLYLARAALRRHFRAVDVLPNWLRSGMGVALCLGAGLFIFRFRAAFDWLPWQWQSISHAPLPNPDVWTFLGALDLGSLIVVAALSVWSLARAASLVPTGSADENPARALQFARSWADVRKAVALRNFDTRHRMTTLVRSDYVFIGSYVSLTLLLGASAALARGPLGIFVGLAGLIAGAADLVENGRMLRLLSSPVAPDSSVAKLDHAPFPAAVTKVVFVGLALVLLACMPWWDRL